MENTEHKKAHDFATNNIKNTVQIIPKRLRIKEENLCGRFRSDKGDPIHKLKILYDFMDEIYEHVLENTPCKKGCNHCCHYNVVVTELEVQYIERETNIKRNENISLSADFHGTPCPFLKEDACSIYESRPFICRRFVAMMESSEWCQPDISNDHEFPMIHFPEIDKSFDLIVFNSMLVKSSDIREQFS